MQRTNLAYLMIHSVSHTIKVTYLILSLQTVVKYKDLRLEIIRETFRDLTGKWDRNFVIFPISGQEDIKLMISRFYFLCYEVDAPLKIRYQRFLHKYKDQKLTLEQFVDFDDKIKFNTEEFSLFVGSADRQAFIKRRFQNKTENIMDFHKELRQFCFNDKQLVRPSFDTYFLRLAWIAASRSNCMKSGIGAVIAKD